MISFPGKMQRRAAAILSVHDASERARGRQSASSVTYVPPGTQAKRRRQPRRNVAAGWLLTIGRARCSSSSSTLTEGQGTRARPGLGGTVWQGASTRSSGTRVGRCSPGEPRLRSAAGICHRSLACATATSTPCLPCPSRRLQGRSRMVPCHCAERPRQ